MITRTIRTAFWIIPSVLILVCFIFTQFHTISCSLGRIEIALKPAGTIVSYNSRMPQWYLQPDASERVDPMRYFAIQFSRYGSGITRLEVAWFWLFVLAFVAAATATWLMWCKRQSKW